MNGVPVDTRSEEFQVMYQNFIAYTPSIVLETMSELGKIISEEIENDIRSERQVLGGDCIFVPKNPGFLRNSEKNSENLKKFQIF